MERGKERETGLFLHTTIIGMILELSMKKQSKQSDKYNFYCESIREDGNLPHVGASGVARKPSHAINLNLRVQCV